MSASLLRKSVKLIDESKGSKKKNLKKKKFKCQRRITNDPNDSEVKRSSDEILSKIKKLGELDAPIPSDICEKILSRKFNQQVIPLKSKEADKTVFTEKDFQEFEKEYFAS